MKKKVVLTLRQERKVKVDIITSDDIKIYYTGKFQDFTARFIIDIGLSDSSPSEFNKIGQWLAYLTRDFVVASFFSSYV